MLHSFPDNRFDWIFVDPARRESGRRSVGLAAASPDVTAAHDLLLSKAPRVMIKASPALEPSGLMADLPSLSEIRVVSVDGECRESLLLLERGGPNDHGVLRTAVLLSKDGTVEHATSGTGTEERVVSQQVQTYFYEPDAAVIRAGLAGKLALDLGLSFVNGSVDYLTADVLIADFPGRVFRVIAVERYRPKTFRDFLRWHDISGAALQRRDFPLKPEEIRRKFRLRESDSRYLFFTRDCDGEPVCIYGVKAAAGGAALSAQARNAAPGC